MTARIEDPFNEDETAIFSIYQNIDRFVNDPMVVAPYYQYFLFFPADEIEQILEKIKKDFAFGLYPSIIAMIAVAHLLFIFGNLILSGIVSKEMVKPIIKLKELIHKSAEGIRVIRQKQQLQDLDLAEQNKMYRKFQIDLLHYFKRTNFELNSLYYKFHMRAKIIFLARAVTS